ncbi:MAG: hypothetical protein ACTH2U_13925 [Brevibacterium sp.]
MSSKMKVSLIATLVALDIFFVWTYVLWSNADTWAINHAEEAGVDQSLLLPNSHMLWVTINLAAVALVIANILVFRVWSAQRRTSLA